MDILTSPLDRSYSILIKDIHQRTCIILRIWISPADSGIPLYTGDMQHPVHCYILQYLTELCVPLLVLLLPLLLPPPLPLPPPCRRRVLLRPHQLPPPLPPLVLLPPLLS